MKAVPLYLQPQNPIYASVPAPIGVATQKTVGCHGGNLQFTDMDSINNCRMTKGSKAVHRITPEVRPCAGYVEQSKSGVNHHACYSKRELRGLAIKVLRQRGEQINEKSIRGILSGKTL